PFVLFAVYFGVRWLAEPTRSVRAAFVAFAVLSVFGRVQYVVVPVAVLLAGLVLRRWRLGVRHVAVALAFAAVLAVGWDRILGPLRGAVPLRPAAAARGRVRRVRAARPAAPARGDRGLGRPARALGEDPARGIRRGAQPRRLADALRGHPPHRPAEQRVRRVA